MEKRNTLPKHEYYTVVMNHKAYLVMDKQRPLEIPYDRFNSMLDSLGVMKVGNHSLDEKLRRYLVPLDKVPDFVDLMDYNRVNVRV